MKREIRSSTVAGMAGVGAVIDVGQESFVIPGIDTWKQHYLRPVDMPRLSARLGKSLKAPIAENPVLMVRRFPRAMFCERCRRLVTWKTEMEKPDSAPVCPHPGCRGRLVPMRFVIACENGHLDDVDWRYWAHSGPRGDRTCKERGKLSFRISDSHRGNAGLESLSVHCAACGSSRTLNGITDRHQTEALFHKCSGHHPWKFGQPEACDAKPVILQRGATNLHYPVTLSALDIPGGFAANEADEYAGQIRGHRKYAKLLDRIRTGSQAAAEVIAILAEDIAEDVCCKTDTVMDVARAEAAGKVPGGGSTAMARKALDQHTLLNEEWKTLEHALENGGLKGAHFSAVPEPLATGAPPWMQMMISGILLAGRLREVRVYTGFQRVKPGNPDATVPPDAGAAGKWLPAAEVFGEGIVIRLDYERLEAWAGALPDAEKQRLGDLENRRIVEDLAFLEPVDPVFIVVHTLSHLLLRRIIFECGYSSSALRERLYVSRADRYAAIMIYTADGDSEGSLGGLVRQGKQDRLAQSFFEAIEQGEWCSADPVCSETSGQGLGGFNRAACHACSLVSETSCTAANTLMDRTLIYHPEWGLLRFLGKDPA